MVTIRCPIPWQSWSWPHHRKRLKWELLGDTILKEKLILTLDPSNKEILKGRGAMAERMCFAKLFSMAEMVNGWIGRVLYKHK